MEQNNISETLKLATIDQLFAELRERPDPYILVRPSDESRRVTAEISGLRPAMALLVMYSAIINTTKSFRDQGILPDDFEFAV